MPVVDLAFPLTGSRVPADHGYALYASICRLRPQLHRTGWLAIHPLPGKPDGDGRLLLPRRGFLRLRLPADHIGDVLLLAGSTLVVEGERISLGVPSVHALAPAATLDSRLVIVKLTDAPTKTAGADGRQTLDVAAFARRYESELARQLAQIDVTGEVQLCGRQRMTVGGKRIVGYSVRVTGLGPDDSLLLQEHGLGGKRAMGCGIFRATREEVGSR